ncbi:MAG: hypothetical protein ACFFDH_04430 [Promethearchaeota archaeon]
MEKVKGVVIISIVKSIRANRQKRGEYDRLLSEKAKEFIKQRILTGSWYPFEEYRECYDALCFVEARNNPKTIVEWGMTDGKRTFLSTYQSTIIKEDIQLAVERYIRFHRRTMTIGEIVSEIISDNEVKFAYTNMPREWENWYHTAVGWAISFIGLCLNKEINYIYLNKSWKNQGWTEVKFSWSP